LHFRIPAQSLNRSGCFKGALIIVENSNFHLMTAMPAISIR
jgi:hypothetical protein